MYVHATSTLQHSVLGIDSDIRCYAISLLKNRILVYCKRSFDVIYEV